jgi:hypothetical protein
MGTEKFGRRTSPKPWTTLKTPGGTPADSTISAMTVAVPGVSSEGFATTVFPAASAGASLQTSDSKGKLQGMSMPITPSGLRTE